MSNEYSQLTVSIINVVYEWVDDGQSTTDNEKISDWVVQPPAASLTA